MGKVRVTALTEGPRDQRLQQAGRTGQSHLAGPAQPRAPSGVHRQWPWNGGPVRLRMSKRSFGVSAATLERISTLRGPIRRTSRKASPSRQGPVHGLHRPAHDDIDLMRDHGAVLPFQLLKRPTLSLVLAACRVLRADGPLGSLPQHIPCRHRRQPTEKDTRRPRGRRTPLGGRCSILPEQARTGSSSSNSLSQCGRGGWG